MADPATRLSRKLGLRDAVVIGLGSMVGTGVFVAWQPAAARAGSWLLLSLAIAAFVALCNATSSAQLAAVHPQSGGTYVYARERLGHPWGALAGYAFVGGKIASLATAALAVGTYLWPEHARLVAIAATVIVTGVNLAGVTKTVRATLAILVFVVTALVMLIILGWLELDGAPVARFSGEDISPLGLLGAAAVLFFAFAGYARIATLGEEVRDPSRTIPRAIPLALAITFVLYLAVGATVLAVLGPGGVADSPRPLGALAEATGAAWLPPIVAIAAGVSALGALFALVAGVSRTVFAMALESDLPRWLGAVHSRRSVPHRAEIATGLVVITVVSVGGLVAALSFSAFAVLLYYALANASALRLAPYERRWPRWMPVAGLVACILLAFSLPVQTVLLGIGWLVLAMVGRAIALRLRHRGSAT